MKALRAAVSPSNIASPMRYRSPMQPDAVDRSLRTVLDFRGLGSTPSGTRTQLYSLRTTRKCRWYRSSYVMRTVALRWIFTLSRVCRTRGWHKADLFGWCSIRERHWPKWTKLDHARNCQFLASA
jgi:hypothetical protein